MMAEFLTVEMIDAVEDIWAGFSLMDRCGVPKENCSCLDDMKERLRLHYQQSRGQGKSVGAVRIGQYTCLPPLFNNVIIIKI